MKMKRFPVGMMWTNCYVVASDSGDAVVIDPGGPMDKVIAYIDEEQLSLRWVLLTHGHADHLFGLDEIRGRVSEGVAICEGDENCLTDPAQNLSGHMGHTVSFGPAERVLKDGETLELGGMKIDVIATPGHTAGGCCFLIGEGDDKILISGDTLFELSIGRADLPGGDEETLIDSLRKLEHLPDEMPVFPGHGAATTIGAERRNNPFWPR